MINSNQLPQDWQLLTLDQVAKWGSGGTPLSSNRNYYGGTIPWSIIGDLNDGYIATSQKSITEEGLINSSAKIIKPNSILIAMYGSIGKLGINKISLATNQAIAFTEELYDNISHKYLFHYLFHIRSLLYSLGKGGTQKNISQTVLKKVTIPVPPILIQNSIVSKIEELFSELDKGIENLKTAQAQLTVYRQAVLKWAFEGRLTNDNVKDGKLPEGWKSLSLKEITLPKDGLRRGPFGSAIKKSFFVHAGYKVYEQGNAINDDPYRGNYFIDQQKYYELENFNVIPGDLIVSCSGVTLGRICEIPKDAAPGVINQALLRIRLAPSIIDNKYFIEYFRSSFFQKLIFAQSQGTAMPNLVGIKDFKEIKLNVPPIKKQKQIIELLQERLNICNSIENILLDNLSQANCLKQSILKDAFEGKLIYKKQYTTNNFERKIFAACLIARFARDNHFGITKFQKTLHLAEYHGQLDFDTHYYQEAAGPLDKFIYELIEEADLKGWFHMVEHDGYKLFSLGSNITELTFQYPKYFKQYKDRLKTVFDMVDKQDTRSAELYSTVYAVWNNYLIDGNGFSDDDLIKDVYNWSKQKEKYTKNEILDAKQLMVANGLVPVGYGKLIAKTN